MTQTTTARPRRFSSKTVLVVGAMLWLLLSACGSDEIPVATTETTTQPDVVAPADANEGAPAEAAQPEAAPPKAAPPEDAEPKQAQPEAPQLAATDVVFIWAEDGGCFQAGPNCARYEITADGTVSTFRVGQDGVEAVAQGAVGANLITAWIAAANETDVPALQARVGAGELTAAFDGVDYSVAAPFAGLELSSVTNDFARSEPLFAAAFALARASFEVAPLTSEFR